LSPPVAGIGDPRDVTLVLEALDLACHVRSLHFQSGGQLTRAERFGLLQPTKDDGRRPIHGNPGGPANQLMPPNAINQIGDLPEPLLYPHKIR
jgi:hypothetical protein